MWINSLFSGTLFDLHFPQWTHKLSCIWNTCEAWHESCFRFAYWEIIFYFIFFTKLLDSITWEHLCVFQCTPPQQPTLMSLLMPAIMMRRGIHTWETGTAWTGWKTLMWWVSSVVIVYSIFMYNILNLVKIEMENLCIVCNILFKIVLRINVCFLWRIQNKSWCFAGSGLLMSASSRRKC